MLRLCYIPAEPGVFHVVMGALRCSQRCLRPSLRRGRKPGLAGGGFYRWFRPCLEGPTWKPQCDDRLSSSPHHIGSAVCHFDTAAARGIPHCGYSRSMVQQGSAVLGRCECLALAPFCKRWYCLGGWVGAVIVFVPRGHGGAALQPTVLKALYLV